jgi:hypothetical protein
MEVNELSINKRVGCCLGVLFFLFFFAFFNIVYAQSAASNENLIQLVSPREGPEVIAKKPLIKCKISKSLMIEDLLVLLDGVDITGVLDIRADGFQYKPIGVLPPGSHTLVVYGNTAAGNDLEKTFSFSTRHFKRVETASVSNELTGVYETVLTKTDDVEKSPNWKVESNLSTAANLKENRWAVSFNSNLRYLGQNLSVKEPLKKGTDLIDYLLSAAYSDGRFELKTEIGDTVIDTSTYTAAGLARRGGQAAIQYADTTLSGFIVKGKEVYGFNDGLGLSSNTDDHIFGVSGGMEFFKNQIGLKAIYIEGGEEGSYFGTYTEDQGQKGDVIGVVLTTDFFKETLTTEFEIDFSEFDEDIADEFSAEEDKAYRLGLGGRLGNYTYETVYEYLGPEYQVIGNQNLEIDRTGFSVAGSAEYPLHSLSLTYTQYKDNVEKEGFYPRIQTDKGAFEYSFNKFENLPMSVRFEKAVVDSDDEPEDTDPIQSDTDTVGATIHYTRGRWQLGLETTYSDQDDETEIDDDTTIETIVLSPVYYTDNFHLSTSAAYQRSESHLTDVVTDYYTVTLDIQGELFNRKITYELGVSYDKNQSDDDETNQDTIRGTGRVAYYFAENLWGYLNLSAGLKVLYEQIDDKIEDEKTDAFTLLFTFETSIPFSF